MSSFSPFAAFGCFSGWLTCCSLLLCGCERAESISKYDVPPHESLQSSEFLAEYKRTHPKAERMIGVVMPRPSLLWFFKLQGDIDSVAVREHDLRNFLQTVEFTPDDEAHWKLPEGWRQLDGNEMRFATVVLNGEPPLEMSVTKFPSRQDLSPAEQVLMNINRWRGQFSLPPIEIEDLDVQSEQVALREGTGYWINIIGRPLPKRTAMQPPLAQTTRESREKEPAQPKPSLKFDRPAEWTEGQPTAFAAVSLQIKDDDKTALVTVTRAGGNVLLNVNRWRGQVGLGPMSEEELAASAKKVSVGHLTGNLYEMTQGDRAIFGVIVEQPEQMWFIKLMGDAPLVERERERFEAFLKSLDLES